MPNIQIISNRENDIKKLKIILISPLIYLNFFDLFSYGAFFVIVLNNVIQPDFLR